MEQTDDQIKSMAMNIRTAILSEKEGTQSLLEGMVRCYYQVNSLRNELITVSNIRDSYYDSIKKYSKDLSDLQRKLMEKETEIQQLRENEPSKGSAQTDGDQELVQEVERLKQEVQNKTDQIVQMKKTLDETSKSIEELRDVIRKKETRIDSLQDDLERKIALLATSEKEYHEKLQSKQEQIDNLEKQMNSSSAAQYETETELRKELAEKQASISELEGLLEASRKKCEKYRQQIAQEEQKRTMKKWERDQKFRDEVGAASLGGPMNMPEFDLETALMRNRSSGSNSARRRSQLGDNTESLAKIEDFRMVVEELKEQKKHLEDKVAKLQGELSASPTEADKQDLELQIQNLQSAKHQVETLAHNQEQQALAAQKHCEDLTKEKADLQRLADQLGEENDNLEKLVAALRKELADYQNSERQTMEERRSAETIRAIPTDLRIATMTSEVDQHSSVEFMESNLSLSGSLRLSKAPPTRAQVIIIDQRAYPNPYYYKQFAQDGEVGSRLEKLRYLFRLENKAKNTTAHYILTGISPARVDLNAAKEYRLLEKGSLELKEKS